MTVRFIQGNFVEKVPYLILSNFLFCFILFLSNNK
jgi:hypothetical protein